MLLSNTGLALDGLLLSLGKSEVLAGKSLQLREASLHNKRTAISIMNTVLNVSARNANNSLRVEVAQKKCIRSLRTRLLPLSARVPQRMRSLECSSCNKKIRLRLYVNKIVF